MGTYTTNYNLFMPSIGEQGWGELVNNNFSIIDTSMGGLNMRMGTAESNITSLTTRMGTAETTIASNKSRIGTLETETDAIEGKVTTIEGKLGTGAYIANAKVPIIAKLSTTDEGYGIVSFANSIDYVRPLGFLFINKSDTYIFTFSGYNNGGGNNPTISVHVRNILDNTTRLLQTKSFPYGNTVTFNLTAYVYEVPYYSATTAPQSPTWTKPAIYIGAPE